jgi:hypothetical protein
MVIVKQHFTEMPTGSDAQQAAAAAALESFMARATNPQSTGSPWEAIDDLSKPPTGFVSAPFVQQPVGPFWEPPVPEVQPDDPVVPKTLAQRVRSSVSSLMRNQISTKTFASSLTQLGFPIFVILNLLTKMDLVCEKNGNQIVQRTNMGDFVKSLVQMKEIVDFIVKVIDSLKEKKEDVFWTMFRNRSSPDYIETTLSKEVLQSVKSCLTELGFLDRNELVKVPSTLASLSESELLKQIWTVVATYDWESAPHRPSKRGRDDDPPPREFKKRMFSLEELMRTVLSRLTLSLLATQGVGEISLCDFFWTAFLDMSPEHLRQMMEFLSNDDTLWRLQRILMEVPHLNVKIHDKDLCLSMGDKFTFISFNVSEMLTQFNGLFLEAIMMRQIAGQELHEQEVREAQERQRVERFRTALWVLWRTKNINVFFQELIAVSPEFNSFTTNWGLLKVVVGEFILNIYNATTRAYHNRAPCNNPLIHFLEYAITRGVFTELPEEGAFVRICDCSLENCIFGNKCSGVHQEVVNKHWRPSGWCFGQCCSEYMNSGKCSNSSCKCAHANLWEILRAYKHGSSDSKMKRELLLQALLKN